MGKREELNALANALLENEVLHKSDVERLIGPRFGDEPASPETINPETSEALETDIADS